MHRIVQTFLGALSEEIVIVRSLVLRFQFSLCVVCRYFAVLGLMCSEITRAVLSAARTLFGLWRRSVYAS